MDLIGCCLQAPSICCTKMAVRLGMKVLIVTLLLPLVQSHSLFTCEPITVPRCTGMNYNMTFFPNLMEHYDQDIAALRMEPFLPLLNLHCSPEVHTFLCRAFVPECTEPKHIMMPCRSLCERVYSDCKNLIETFGITWPAELECDRMRDCNNSQSRSGGPDDPQDARQYPGKAHRDFGFWCPQHLKTSQGSSFKFLGVDHCTPPCPNMYFTKVDLDFAKYFIGIISIICLCVTLFTVLTFLIDVKRFRYPERPIIFYSVCYSMVSLMYVIGFLIGNSIACNERGENFASGDTVVIGSQHKACTFIFMLLYFCTMAGTIWWVMLTITWFLAAGRKWSCEAIEQKSLWFHGVAWAIPGILTIILLAMNKVEGDNIGGVCFVGLYDQEVSVYFVLLPLCLCVFIGLSFLLAGIISLNNVRQVIQHDERNKQKLKKFMIRIGVFSGTYLVPLVILLGCYAYEQVYRSSWEMTWVSDNCQDYHIPCPYQVKNPARPDLGLFITKYIMTLIVGIAAIFWVGSKKTCSEWANFLNRSRKQDPISESRRVLQESCEFFLKHNAKVKHKKKKHSKSGSHKLKVISKSMGTSTGGKLNHNMSAVAITNNDFLGQEASGDVRSTLDVSRPEDLEGASCILKSRDDITGEVTTQTLLDGTEAPVEYADCNNKPRSRRGNGLSGSIHTILHGSLHDVAENRVNVENASPEPDKTEDLSKVPGLTAPHANDININTTSA
ncbi:frizzled-6 isoform X1 [Xenopus laevis]|uniref:Frizzled-6 n=2 Tax=Xenopus laevis TaxID=8355 RepID=A0A1L8FZR1_XENLA|nr:frizzled-6 isoform X1 [Xenopus laevis]XP_018123681.1 frizzled-6 isoform X1 [Xenopus laevis]OCT77071.1 hypothetical protein XELAEV_18032266mg [Xenopus laevis]